MNIWIGIGIGVGLAAACGFRVFLPLLLTGLAARYDVLPVPISEGFAWLQSTPALVALGVATGVEILAYYIPWLDNALDTIASPAAVLAGVITAAACMSDAHPMLQWSLAVIAGGGSAGVVQGASVVVRAASSLASGGLGNFVVATLELICALILSLLAVFLWPLALAVVLLLAIVSVTLIRRWLAQRRGKPKGLDFEKPSSA